MEVTPEQAEILNLASSEGKIRLALRGRRNETVVQTPGAAISQLFAGITDKKKEDKPEPKAVAAVQEKKEERTVEVIKGLERSKSTL